MRCYHKLLCISYKDHVTNEVVPAKIQQAIRPHEDLLTIVKRCKLQWYGHVTRSSDLAKTILQGTEKGGRTQDRQRKRWEDNIRERTGLEFAKSQRAVENRGKWRKLIAKSSVVSQWPLWVRDRWWWWWWTLPTPSSLPPTCALQQFTGCFGNIMNQSQIQSLFQNKTLYVGMCTEHQLTALYSVPAEQAKRTGKCW